VIHTIGESVANECNDRRQFHVRARQIIVGGCAAHDSGRISRRLAEYCCIRNLWLRRPRSYSLHVLGVGG
jgi:hypothetical protein